MVVVAIVATNSSTCRQIRSWNLGRGSQAAGIAGGSRSLSAGSNGSSCSAGLYTCTRASSGEMWPLADVLEILAGLEANRAAGRNANFFSSAGVTADSTLARLHLEDPKAPQFDSFTALHRGAHRVEHCIDRHLSLDFGDV